MARRITSSDGKTAVYAFAQDWDSMGSLPMLPVIDIHKQLKKSGDIDITPDGLNVKLPTPESDIITNTLDITRWLPFASPHYKISPNIDDYVLCPVIVMPSDLPNRNAVAFPRRELAKFHPNLGQQAYSSWKGKPTHYEHDNQDITKAYGVIADTYMRKMALPGGASIWKLLLLLTFDRSKHPDVVNRILSGELNSYSMGAYVGKYTCSYCGEEWGYCPHLDKRNPTQFYVLNGKLVFRNVEDIEGFECSAVASPAYISAISDTLIQMKR